jgi:hypothetical protein
MHLYMTGSVKQNQSYSDTKTAWKCRFQSKLERNFGFGARVRISSRTKLQEQFGQIWSMDYDLFRLGWILKCKSFNSVLPFWAESVSDRRWFQKSQLTETGADSGKIINTKAVYNFDGFPKSINTPSYDQWIMSYDLFKLGVLLKFISGQNKIPGQIWNLSLLPMVKWKYLEYRDHRAFPKLSNEG